MGSSQTSNPIPYFTFGTEDSSEMHRCLSLLLLLACSPKDHCCPLEQGAIINQVLARTNYFAADAHFRWGAMFMGYLLFDTVFNLYFYKQVGNVPFLFHHALGFVCCAFGLYFHRLAIFGISIQVRHTYRGPAITL